MKTILVTGAAGRIGSFLRPELRGKYRLRLSDIVPIGDLQPGRWTAFATRADQAGNRWKLTIPADARLNVCPLE